MFALTFALGMVSGITMSFQLGITLSAFRITMLNPWMHTPDSFELRGGGAHATDGWAIVFNPSMPYRPSHMMIASGLAVAFRAAGISACRWRRVDRGPMSG